METDEFDLFKAEPKRPQRNANDARFLPAGAALTGQKMPWENDDPKRAIVLIVDDDPGVRASLGYALESDYRLIFSSSGDEGIQAVNEDVSAVVLDIKMQGKDGFETFWEIKKKFSTLPIIFHSAYQDLKDPYAVMNEYRPFGYINKDGGAKELTDTLVSAVQYHQQIRKNEILVHALQKMTAELAQTNIELRASERQLEARVQERTLELSATIERLNQTQADLVQSEKLASLGGLVAGVAHELNTPLGNALITATTLQAAAQQFQAAVSSGEIRRSALANFAENSIQMTDLIARSCARAASLITSFKQVAADQTSEQKRAFDLLELIEDNIASLRPSLKGATWCIECDVPTGILCDSYPGPLGQVLVNLIQNAGIHAFNNASAAGILRISAVLEGDTVNLVVSDNGKGIAPEVLGRIFEPFFTTKLGTGGSGLGLAICRNIVTGMLGGQLRVTSRLDEGTRFIVQFPRVSPGADN